MASKKTPGKNLIAQNRRAWHDYTIQDEIETGIILYGTEVKALRRGRASIGEAYAGEQGGEVFLFNAYIPPYEAANRFNHEVRRPRKLLVHKREVKKLAEEVQRKGSTLVPLSFYFNEDGRVKVQLGIAIGKRKADKRQADKERDWKRDKERLLRDRN